MSLPESIFCEAALREAAYFLILVEEMYEASM